ncbi:hypothetical protein PAXINDRAFT_11078 [Paxillus involutus ATCC 200175]|nr:hypothetical protein PAXINDRAFT_11078 [Paxillus involutus ATCC 200175]
MKAFTSEAALNAPVEDRIVEVSIGNLQRPVRYFWSIQDFVMGLLGAVQGHQFLVENGILHRDASENNIVLACHPDDPRGQIMDFDMAIPYQRPAEPKSLFLPSPAPPLRQSRRLNPVHLVMDPAKLKGPEQLLTCPLISYLEWGNSITEVPRSKLQLMVAGVERNEMIATMEDIRSNWGSDLLPMIQDLIKPCRKLFLDAFRYQVTHEQFIGVLKKWLADYGIPQERYNNCPVYENGKQRF